MDKEIRVDTPEWDPASWPAGPAGVGNNPAAIYEAQRNRCPVSFDETELGQRLWHAFAHQDVSEILSDTAVFSSNAPKFGRPMIPIELDPPEHGVFRGLLSKMMAPRRLVAYEQSIRATVVAGLSKLVEDGGGDVVPLAHDIPLRTFALLVGEEDTEKFSELDRQSRAVPGFERTDADANAQRVAGLAPLIDFCRSRLEERRGNPRDDLASDIANGTIDDLPIDLEDATRMLTLVYMAGHDTTAMAMQGAILMLATHRDVQDRLRQSPRHIVAAMEECLRLQTPLHTLPRSCKFETQLRGRTILPGDQIYPVFASANVDPALFPDPQAFDIDRKPNHFSFGRGVHACPGAPLARLEMRVLIEELLARSRSFRLGEGATRKPWPRNGFLALPIIIEV